MPRPAGPPPKVAAPAPVEAAAAIPPPVPSGTSPSITTSANDANGWQINIPGSPASFRVKQSGAGFGVYLRVTENGARPETYLCYLNAPDAAEAKGRGLEDFLSLILERIEQRQAKAKTAAERHRLADLAARIFAYLPAHPDTARAISPAAAAT